MNKKNNYEDVFIHKSSFVDENVKIGLNTKIWHFCHVSKGASIGKNVILGQNVFVGNNVVIGDGCKIQNNVSVYEGVNLDKDVFIGPSVVFTNVNFPRANLEQKNNFLKTIVKSGVSIGANSTIICGVTLGENSFIGAGSVVKKNVLPNSLVYGVPAKHIKFINN